MIVWVASWPRSENTFTRILLNRRFGLETYSIHNDAYFVENNAVGATVGHRCYSEEQTEFLQWAREQKIPILIKTHEAPVDDSPAIYVVRHGLAAAVSFRHYLEDTSSLDVPLLEIVDGRVIYGSWGDHVKAWDPLGRSNTLVLHYEQLTSDALPQMVEEVECFLHLRSMERTVPLFRELNDLDCKFFRSGSNAENLAEVSPEARARFWDLHGEVAANMGYAPAHN
jgi:hypothetical protein